MTNQQITDSIKLYGTDESVAGMTVLRSGRLSACLDTGALRFICIDGVEAIRNIAFVVRDKDWGTYSPELSNLHVTRGDDSFSVNFQATFTDDDKRCITCDLEISCRSGETLNFNAAYRASDDFITNRTGFVVLHPINGVAGKSLTVERVDGQRIEAEFPALIDPVQPFKDIRSLTHEVTPGTRVCCEMTGDTFEMEDHRQWNDASFKTYVRPLALPWPYTIQGGENLRQSIVLSLINDGSATVDSGITNETCQVSVGTSTTEFCMPPLGLGVEPQHLDSTIDNLPLLQGVGARHLTFWHDTRFHGLEDLRKAAEISAECSVEASLQAVIPDNDYCREIDELAALCKAAGLTPATVTISPSAYLKSIMPGPDWPAVTSLDEIYRTTQLFFPQCRAGGGMLAFFAEINRHRPPLAHLDFVTHASNTITHASDDITVTENLEALPHIIKSCRAFIKDKPYHLGPSSIGMRFNPYGSKVIDNPDNKRVAMARIEPRHRGLLNAAWTLGYVAHAANNGIDAVSLHAPTGEFGLINTPQPWSQPGYDDSHRIVYPVYPVVRALAADAGYKVKPVECSNNRCVAALGYESEQGECTLWLANLTSVEQPVQVSGDFPEQSMATAVSLDTWEQCVSQPDGFEQTRKPNHGSTNHLGPYEVLRLTSTL